MSAVTWGIVSTADINRLVIPGAHASPKVELRGVASRDRARAEAYAREWEIPVAYGSYEELLADPAIEAVYISLPNTHHCEWSVKAVEAGKLVGRQLIEAGDFALALGAPRGKARVVDIVVLEFAGGLVLADESVDDSNVVRGQMRQTGGGALVRRKRGREAHAVRVRADARGREKGHATESGQRKNPANAGEGHHTRGEWDCGRTGIVPWPRDCPHFT